MSNSRFRYDADDIIEIDICPDCLCYHINGDLPDDGIEDEVNAKSFEAIVTAAGIDHGYDVETAADGAGDGFFSHQPCDACRRPFGGQRYTAIMVPSVYVPADRSESNLNPTQ